MMAMSISTAKLMKIARVEISIDERCLQVKKYFQRHKGRKIDFEELFDNPSPTYFVVTFLAFGLDFVLEDSFEYSTFIKSPLNSFNIRPK